MGVRSEWVKRGGRGGFKYAVTGDRSAGLLRWMHGSKIRDGVGRICQVAVR